MVKPENTKDRQLADDISSELLAQFKEMEDIALRK